MKNDDNIFSWNMIVDKISGCMYDMMMEGSLSEIENKENIIVVRSAKDEVMQKFLAHLCEVGYRGNLYVIGRECDKKYISEYPQIKIVLYTIQDDDKYSVENTKAYINNLQVDAICFLYQKELSCNHNNLFRIIMEKDCAGFAVSRDIDVVKFNRLKMQHYLIGEYVYNALCDWFYEADKPL